MPYLIIGIDPGSTVGVAALGLDGKPAHAAHIQNGGLNAAVALIESWGTPSLIATDVKPAPDMARRLAASFNAPLFVPAHPWREEDKREAMRHLERNFSFSHENTHERDALSAAVQAWRAHQNLLRSARASDERLDPEKKERILHLLLNGYRHEFAREQMEEEDARRERNGAGDNEAWDGNATGAGRGGSKKTPFAPSDARERLALERANAELKKRIGLLENERDELLHRIRLLENGVRADFTGNMKYRRMEQRIAMLEKRLAYEHGMNAHLRKKLRQAERIMQEAGRAGKSAQMRMQKKHEEAQAAGGAPEEARERIGSRTGERDGRMAVRDGRTGERDGRPDTGEKAGAKDPPSHGNDEANLKGLDSFALLESLIRQYRKNRAEYFSKE